jgi:predicted restriction endonuclease
VFTRIGQKKFADTIKGLYQNRCCFPGCGVADPRFLVASHIARWSDNEALRGHTGNGLCFCLMHDRAFELGLFTLDGRRNVFLNPRENACKRRRQNPSLKRPDCSVAPEQKSGSR